MALHKPLLYIVFIGFLSTCSCLKYSFTGTSIPENVNTIFIPFFPDQSNSGIGDLSDRLTDALIQRFVNESRLQLVNNEESADAVINGQIISYSNRPFSIGGDEQANQNQVQIQVSASFKYRTDDAPIWDKKFNGSFNFDPADDPVEGEENAANDALEQIANNMFNDAVSSW